MPGIPANFPKPTILVHPPMHFDTGAMWIARNADWLRVANAFFSILADAKSAKEVRYRVQHRDTWHGESNLYTGFLLPNEYKIGRSTCSVYEVHNCDLDIAAELFTMNSKRKKMLVAKVGGESIDLAEHSQMWHYNGHCCDKIGSLLDYQQRWHLSLLTKKCLPVVGEEKSRQFAAQH